MWQDLTTLDIDPATITWRRVMDTNDRMLRQITIGDSSGSSKKNGGERMVSPENPCGEGLLG